MKYDAAWSPRGSLFTSSRNSAAGKKWGRGSWNCETAFLVRVTLLSIWKETRRPTFKPGKCPVKSPLLYSSWKALKQRETAEQYVLFNLRARALLSLLFVLSTGSLSSSFSLQLASTKLQTFNVACFKNSHSEAIESAFAFEFVWLVWTV